MLKQTRAGHPEISLLTRTEVSVVKLALLAQLYSERRHTKRDPVWAGTVMNCTPARSRWTHSRPQALHSRRQWKPQPQTFRLVVWKLETRSRVQAPFRDRTRTATCTASGPLFRC